MSLKSTYDKKDANYTRSIKLRSGTVTFFCVILTIITLIPLYLLIINATRSQTELAQKFSILPSTNFGHNFDVLKSFGINFLVGFKNSLIYAGCATILSLFVSCLTAYGLVVYEFKLRDPAFTFILAVLMVPAQVSGLGFMNMIAHSPLKDTLFALILPAAAAPAIVFFMRQYMKSAFPLDIVEAARIDGSSEFRTFLTIGIPLMKPAIAVQAIFAFIAHWNNYFTPSIVIISDEHKTLPMMMKALSSNPLKTDIGAIYCGIAIAIIPLVIVYLILSRFIIEGVALGGVKE